MRRQMVRFLQKRKFRLAIRWKLVLTRQIGSRLPSSGPFPYALVFRTFDELVALLKTGPQRSAPGGSLLAGLPDAAVPVADHYMELFLTGHDVLQEFMENDAAFCARFTPEDRSTFRKEMQQTFKCMVDREMTEHGRRLSPHGSRESGRALHGATYKNPFA
jgi:hypothetical protein